MNDAQWEVGFGDGISIIGEQGAARLTAQKATDISPSGSGILYQDEVGRSAFLENLSSDEMRFLQEKHGL